MPWVKTRVRLKKVKTKSAERGMSPRNRDAATIFGLLAWVTLVLMMVIPAARAERIKDLAQVGGVRSNPLVGYGLVVGLDGTGDRTSQAPFTVQSLKNLLGELGVNVPANVNPQLKNVAAVAIHADLPAFAKPGQPIDITVSSIGNSTSLRGGSLLMAPLRGADGEVYAIAQGNLVVGGFGAQGRDGSKVSVNVPSVGRIPNGAIVERAVPNAMGEDAGGNITLNLHQADFTTVSRMVDALQARFGNGSAAAVDAVTVVVRAPQDPGSRVMFMAQVENLELNPGSAAAKIVVNARTGTVVIGSNVTVMPAAVTHGSLTVTITESAEVSQPNSFTRGGQAVVVPQSTVTVNQEGNRMFKFEGGTSLDEIVRAVNEVGAAPGDLIAILEALKQAGALRAELEII
ncbi:flagellar P-ring protein precursor FlgI [Pseudoxanthomonas indica]|uniref:Flagellar P-ring protein n=2 Tax=Pseudoxanthomonas indica TaxID=428993 RepID=A0A1T5LWZ4_9GAMM|nr:flagellar P-ring protein [Pseudoxanthomonas indica]SKC80491.1 flagellar P-ring protein precursor FlgI [Pseudoxanthomonas indica]